MNTQSFVKLIVYLLIAATVMWNSLLLSLLSLWSVSYRMTWRLVLPTIEIDALRTLENNIGGYGNSVASSPIGTAMLSYWIITSIIVLILIFKNLKKRTEFLIELKYALVFVTLLTHSLLIVNLYRVNEITSLVCGIISIILLIFFLWSVRKEKASKIS